ncbi:MAG: hypothetical protein IT281_05685 [Ignavibacteria bacterium]|nr:hypothetical protein [Ignavibacteria bacterium]MCC7159009.1 hypothetical protein [Ignavibacteria bacterium]
MRTKQFVLTAIAVAALFTASLTSIFAGDQNDVTLNCYENNLYMPPDGNGSDDDDTTDGGIIIFPGGN